MLLEKLPKVKRKIEANGGDEPDSKKMKKEDPEEAAEKEKMKKQNKQMFYYRDLLSKHLKKQDLYNLLEHNKQEIPTGEVSTRQSGRRSLVSPHPCTSVPGPSSGPAERRDDLRSAGAVQGVSQRGAVRISERGVDMLTFSDDNDNTLILIMPGGVQVPGRHVRVDQVLGGQRSTCQEVDCDWW